MEAKPAQARCDAAEPEAAQLRERVAVLEGEGSKLRKAKDRQQSCDEGSAEQEGADDAGDTAVNARVQEAQGQV